jgi:signal transduction histidine kinase
VNLHPPQLGLETPTQKSTKISVDIDPSLSSIEADPKSLKQILYNYLSNALKFTPEGGRPER